MHVPCQDKSQLSQDNQVAPEYMPNLSNLHQGTSCHGHYFQEQIGYAFLVLRVVFNHGQLFQVLALAFGSLLVHLDVQ